jgi:hypothetical protein
MSQATGYALLVPPEVTANEVSVAVAVLIGGDGLDTALTVTLEGGSSAWFDGPIAIPPGSTWGSARFRATGAGGSATVSATHTGGNTGMGDPAPASLTIHAPVADPPAAATYFSAAMVSLAAAGPVGQAQPVYVRVAPGYVLSAPLSVTLADDGGGTFVNNPVVIAGSPGYALAGYIPATPGLRTITVTPSGGGGIGHYPVDLGIGLPGSLRFNAVG